MSITPFDKKFGEQLVPSAPTGPGVYRYLDSERRVLYVGKAKNLRRRLSNYRLATRKKAHRKLRILVREAHELVYEVCASEEAALLRESELIRQLRPPYNVDGAYAFLYPSLGLGTWRKTTLLCFSTQPGEFSHLALQWYGCFRSRPRAKLAFSALIDLLSLVGHREKVAHLPPYPKLKGSRLVGLRQLSPELRVSLAGWLAGEHAGLPRELAVRLLAKPRALREAAQVQANLKMLHAFYETDAARLRAVLDDLGLPLQHVSQDDRDALFIRAQAKQRQ